MVSCLTAFLVAAALGQARPAPAVAAEAAWLKSVPAEAEVVVRVRGLTAARDDLTKMIEAMSPNLAGTATPMIDQGLEQFRDRYGEAAATNPFLVVFRLPDPGTPPPPPFAVVIRADKYDDVLKHIAGKDGDAKPKRQPGGYDRVDSAEGQPTFVVKGDGYVAFGPDEALIRSFAKPKATIDTVITGPLRSRLFHGDLGVYVNVAAIQKRFGDQIDKARQNLLDQLGKQDEGTNAAAGAMKSAVDGAFGAIKNAEALALSIDFAADGLSVAGDATVKEGSPAVKTLAVAKTGTGEPLDKLPGDAANYVYARVNPASFEKLSQLRSQVAGGGSADGESPDARKARELLRAADPRETSSAVTIGEGGMRALSVTTFADPRKAVDGMLAEANALKGQKGKGVIKDVTVEPKAQTYRGYQLARVAVVNDLDKMAKLTPNLPVDAIKKQYGEKVSTWFGTNGKDTIKVVAPDWDSARAQIDAYLDGKDPLSRAQGYQALRKKLPDQVGFLLLLSAQGIVKNVHEMLLAVQPQGANGAKEPVLPKSPAFLGGSVTPNPRGYQFHFLVPSAVGPILEQGLLPLLQGAGGAVKQ